jgi:serine/threonine-protein kinase
MPAKTRSDSRAPCPSRDDLAAYAQGTLPEAVLKQVVDHLAVCASCESLLQTLGINDTIVGRLRQCFAVPLPELEPEYRRLEALARAIEVDSPSNWTVSEVGPTLTDPNDQECPQPVPFGSYLLLEKIGKGGMGVVYKARQTGLNRLVALKMILAGAHAGPEELDRFHREAEAIARLRHPNVIQIHDCGVHEGQAYFSMELVEGGTLARRLAGQPLPPAEAAELAQTLARAVQAAHEQQIIHRDLKPGNILLDSDGSVRITDFGLAKLLDADSAQTQSEAILGTPSYMAPEQARGDVKTIGPGTDVYALGAVLYEMLAGRPPFKGATRLETLDQVRTAEPAPPSRWQRGVPRDLEAVCLKCLEKNPADRYPSAAAFAEDLGRWMHGESTVARPQRWPGRIWRRARRHAWISLSLAAVGLAVVLFLTATYFRDPERRREQIEARLVAGETVTLIGETGGPAWSQVRNGEESTQVSARPNEPFSVHSWGHALVELMHDSGRARYRFRAEVRHDKSDGLGQVGIYVAHREQHTSAGLVPHFIPITFNDIFSKKDDHARLAQEFPALTPPKGNPVELSLTLLGNGPQRPLSNLVELGLLSVAQFQPAGAGRRWRQLVLEVTPERIRASWEHERLREVSAPVAMEQLRNWIEGKRKKRPNETWVNELDSGFNPRGALGLCVLEASASFRRVVVEPLEEVD